MTTFDAARIAANIDWARPDYARWIIPTSSKIDKQYFWLLPPLEGESLIVEPACRLSFWRGYRRSALLTLSRPGGVIRLDRLAIGEPGEYCDSELWAELINSTTPLNYGLIEVSTSPLDDFADLCKAIWKGVGGCFTVYR